MIQRITQADAQELFTLTTQNRQFLRQWLPWLDETKTLDDTKEFISNSTTAFEIGHRITYTIRESNQLAGICGFNQLDFNNKIAYIGYWIGESFQSRGIVTKACLELEKIAFDDLKLKTLDIRVAAKNHKSRAIPERLGYQKITTLPNAETLYGKQVNHIVYQKQNLLDPTSAPVEHASE
ncbi:MAG: GNAT family N-acetyltransferase [Akkermansiaceae bacterium]